MTVRTAFFASTAALAMITSSAALAAPGDPVAEWSWESTGTFINWVDSLGSSGTDSSFIFTQPSGASESSVIGWGGGAIGACTSAADCTPAAAPAGDFTNSLDYASLALSAGSSANLGSSNITTGSGAGERVIDFDFRNVDVASSSVILESAEIKVSFDLTAAVPALGDTNVMRGEIELEFWEIDNNGENRLGDSFQCIGGTTPGGPCADIIIINDALNNAFEFNGVAYTYSVGFEELEETPLTPGAGSSIFSLSDSECAALGQLAGCRGFYVQEAYQLLGAFTLDIEQISVTVPEPMSLALLGSGLAGLGLARRRKAA